MAYWWVSQNQTVEEEHSGGYLWAPVKNASGQAFFHWENMTRVQGGDIVFSYVGKAIIAAAVAQGPSYRSPRPFQSPARELWEQDGWRIEVAYDPVDPPVPIAPFAGKLLKLLPGKYGPLTREGTGVQGYLFALPPDAGALLLEELGREHPEGSPEHTPRPARPMVVDDLTAALRPRREVVGRKGERHTPAYVRRSSQAKKVGDRAEAVVFDWLQTHLPEAQRASLTWPARDGQQTGWDIHYLEGTRQIAIEVKGTTTSIFSSIEVTANEWQAAQEKGEDYWLYLVTHCMTAEPRITRFRDPFSRHRSGNLEVTPLLWRLELRA